MTYTTVDTELDQKIAYRMGQEARKEGRNEYPEQDSPYNLIRNKQDAPVSWFRAWDNAYRDGWNNPND